MAAEIKGSTSRVCVLTKLPDRKSIVLGTGCSAYAGRSSQARAGQVCQNRHKSAQLQCELGVSLMETCSVVCVLGQRQTPGLVCSMRWPSRCQLDVWAAKGLLTVRQCLLCVSNSERCQSDSAPLEQSRIGPQLLPLAPAATGHQLQPMQVSHCVAFVHACDLVSGRLSGCF